jgi:hypothetical protein
MWARGTAVLFLSASLALAQSKTKAPAKAAPKSPTKAATKAAPKAKAAPAPVEAPKPAVVVPTRTLPPPKDESGRDKTLAAFFVKLKDVLKRKDRDALLAMLAPDIELGIRDMTGKGAFFTAWGLADRDASVYGVISQILSLNGVWVYNQFCSPYVSVDFPQGLDRSKHQVVLNPDVKMRASQSTTAPVVATLAYDIVEVLERGQEWTKVRTIAGAEGYVPIAYLYSPAGYRACFSKSEEGTWQLQSLALPR